MEDRPKAEAGVVATHRPVTSASPAATGSVSGVLTGRPLATGAPVLPEPTQKTFHKTVTVTA
jgi:hypothetical protein